MSDSYDRRDPQALPSLASGARYIIAFFFAALAPAIAVALPAQGLAPEFFYAFVVAVIHVLLFALPLVLIGHEANAINVVTSTIGGLIVGAVPAALSGAPNPWLSLFAALGTLGGFTFWLTLKCLSDPPTAKEPHSDE